MELRVLNYFLAVAREKNISRAAKTLHVSQPTLSKQLKDLEEELDVTLFIRGSREIQLTNEGQYLFSKSKEIMSLIEKTKNNLSSKEIITGEIHIGGGETQAISLVAEVIHSFTTDYPQVKFHLYSGNADDVMDKLDNGTLDFGLVIDPSNKQKYNHLRLPSKDQWGILLSVNHPLAAHPVIAAEDLEGVPLLVSQQTLVNNQLSEWLGYNLEHLNIVGSYNLLYNASLMVEAKIGCALCLDGIINTTGKNIKFIPLAPKLTAPLNIIWKKEQTLSSAANKFLSYLEKNI